MNKLLEGISTNMLGGYLATYAAIGIFRLFEGDSEFDRQTRDLKEETERAIESYLEFCSESGIDMNQFSKTYGFLEGRFFSAN
jgi:hypothetical protein|tara:strand:+ start:685 stop:933 length:249 start_codon:yes stop_codon:yes gene_type:complete